jgi:hypothetical protein
MTEEAWGYSVDKQDLKAVSLEPEGTQNESLASALLLVVQIHDVPTNRYCIEVFA